MFLQITSDLRVPCPEMDPGGSSSGRRPQRDLDGNRRWPDRERPGPLLVIFLSTSGTLVIGSRPHECLSNAPTHTEILFPHSSEFCFIIQVLNVEPTCFSLLSSRGEQDCSTRFHFPGNLGPAVSSFICFSLTFFLTPLFTSPPTLAPSCASSPSHPGSRQEGSTGKER